MQRTEEVVSEEEDEFGVLHVVEEGTRGERLGLRKESHVVSLREENPAQSSRS
jgi:hypothetical protein